MWTLLEKYSTPSARAAEQLLERLAAYKPYIHATSANKRSVYIHFENLPNGLTHKLRISDHEERERYGYKWQLRLDGLANVRLKKLRRYYEDIEILVEAFHRYYKKVEALNGELLNRVCEKCGEPLEDEDQGVIYAAGYGRKLLCSPCFDDID